MKKSHFYAALALLQAKKLVPGFVEEVLWEEDEAYWRAYVSSIPDIDACGHFPILWSEAQLIEAGEAIAGTASCVGEVAGPYKGGIFEKIKKSRVEIQCLWEEMRSVLSSVEDGLPSVPGSPDGRAEGGSGMGGWEDLGWAICMVQSRAMYNPDGEECPNPNPNL